VLLSRIAAILSNLSGQLGSRVTARLNAELFALTVSLRSRGVLPVPRAVSSKVELRSFVPTPSVLSDTPKQSVNYPNNIVWPLM
jgi:hypothetical protein